MHGDGRIAGASVPYRASDLGQIRPGVDVGPVDPLTEYGTRYRKCHFRLRAVLDVCLTVSNQRAATEAMAGNMIEMGAYARILTKYPVNPTDATMRVAMTLIVIQACLFTWA